MKKILLVILILFVFSSVALVSASEVELETLGLKGMIDSKSACYDCHSNLTRTDIPDVARLMQVTEPVHLWDMSIHKEKGVDCEACHRPAGDVTREEVIEQAGLCTREECHGKGNVSMDYSKSIHAESLKKGNLDAATCRDCHNRHDIRPTKEMPKGWEIEACGSDKCHASQELADKYGMSNVVEGWEENIMFRRGMIGEEGIPTCVDCHIPENINAHKIVGRDDPTSSVNVNNRAKTCGKDGCHPAFKNKGKFDVPIHLTFPPDKAKYFPEWVTFRFMEILLIGTMGLFIPLFGLDIIRKFEERGKGGEHK
ncbi:MAG TPA: hypothetical protein ENH13_01925 [Euryarchaeota archaeon]|nr:hypothetical protein [Euryarchaeota archaeon]